jgi:hypothetical protein
MKPRMLALYSSFLDSTLKHCVWLVETNGLTYATPALVVLRDGAFGREQMFAVSSWHRRRLPPPRLHHCRQVRAGGDKVLAHAYASRVSRNHRRIDSGLRGHIFQKAGDLACFKG